MDAVRKIPMGPIREANAARGGHFFDADTLRFFKSKIARSAYAGPGGTYFVTSEQGPDERRAWSVRRFDPNRPRTIETVGQFQGFRTQEAADEKALTLAHGRVTD